MKPWASVIFGLFIATSGTLCGQTSPPASSQSTRGTRPAAGTSEDVIRERLAGYASAVNQRNAAAVADFFADDAALIDVDGLVVRGKEAIGEQFAAGFAEPSVYTLETTADSLRFLTPDVVQVEGTSKLRAPNEPSIINGFTALVVHTGNVWQLAEIRDLPAIAEDIPPYERLRELEWMVGEWVDDSPNATINTSITWGPERAFLLRSTTAQVGREQTSSSLMVLGWDVRTAQIRSWLFDSKGGRGEAVWTRSAEDQWVIKAEGTLRDGTPTSATQIVTLTNKDSVKTSSLDRIIGGEIAPDIVEVVTVRKPPAPGSGRGNPEPPAR